MSSKVEELFRKHAEAASTAEAITSQQISMDAASAMTLEGDANAAFDEVAKLETEIIGTRADTINGVRAKLALGISRAKDTDAAEDEPHMRLLSSALADLTTLAAIGVPALTLVA